MPFRLIPILAIAALVLLFASGTFDDTSSANDTFMVDTVISEVDGILDGALHEDSFEWLSDSLSGAAESIEGGVEVVID
ncbi:MAG: hypothetical protein IH957_03525 [Chloroflexi bacterium]|nr:hypothetical protein [Chloroflexota bacterium]